MKKFLAILLSVMLTLLPMAAMAESETGFASIKVSDPVITSGGLTLDFTGLQAELTAAVDAADPAKLAATLTAALLSGGEEVLSGAAALDSEQFAFVLNGMKNAYKMNLKDAMGDEADMAAISSMFAVMPTDADFQKRMEDIAAELEGMMKTEEIADAQVEFGGETVNATAYKMEIDKAMIIAFYQKIFDAMNFGEASKEMLEQMDEAIEDVAMTVTVYEIDEKNVVEDITGSMTADGDTMLIDGHFVIEVLDEDGGADVKGTMTMREDTEDGEAVSMDFAMRSESSTEFEDAQKANIQWTMTMPGQSSDPMFMFQADLVPKAVSNGFSYGFSMDAEVVDGGKFNISGNSEKTDGKLDTDVVVTFEGMDDSASGQFGFEIMGDVTENGDEIAFAGTVNFNATIEGMEVGFDAKIETLSSDSIDGKMLAIDSLNAVDLMDQSVRDTENMQNELMGIMGEAMTKLSNNPGVQTIMMFMGMGETGAEVGEGAEAIDAVDEEPV